MSTNSITHHIVALVTLCDKGDKQSHSLWEADDSWIEIQPCKDKPNTHAWNTKGSFRSNHLPFILTRGSEPPQATAGPYALPKCRTYVCSATTKPILLVAQQHVFLHVEQSNQKKQIHVVGGMSTPRADWLLGLPLTIFHGMWLVLSNA
jgi:hypothetical protein